LDKMFDLYSDVIPVNWDAECKQQDSFTAFLIDPLVETNNFNATIVAIVGVVIAILLIVLLILGGMILYRRRGYNEKWYYRMDG